MMRESERERGGEREKRERWRMRTVIEHREFIFNLSTTTTTTESRDDGKKYIIHKSMKHYISVYWKSAFTLAVNINVCFEGKFNMFIWFGIWKAVCM